MTETGRTGTSTALSDAGDNYLSRDLQYASILKISIFKRMKEYLYVYFAKVHASAGVPSYIGYVYFIIISIDSMLPSLLIDADDLWPNGSFFTEMIQIISAIFIGSSQNREQTRIITSMILCIIILLAIIIIFARGFTFQHSKRITSSEIMATLIIFKYILPLTMPLLLSGVPIAFFSLIDGRGVGANIFVAIFSPLTFILFMYLLHNVFVPRVLMEDIPTHEWLPHLATASIGSSSILTMVATIPSFMGGKHRIGITIFMFILSGLCGLIVFYATACPRRLTCCIIGAVGFSASATSLLQTINLALPTPLAPEIIIVVLVVVCILVAIVLSFLNTKMVLGLMQFCDALQDLNDEDAECQMMDERFKGKRLVFLATMRGMIEQWHPYFLSWKFFNYAIEKWPNSSEILVMYGRLLSFFPNHNDKMVWVSSILGKQAKAFARTSYLLQFRHIARTRQTTITVPLKKELDNLKTKVDILLAYIRRFWENILQKNISSFWDDSSKINHHIEEIDSLFCQLIDDYPNNPDILEAYLEFSRKVHQRVENIQKAESHLETVKKFGKIRSDLPFSIAMSVYPRLDAFSKDILDFAAVDEEDENEAKKDEDDISKRQLEFAIQDIAKHSKLGTVWIGVGVCFVMTLLSIGLFLLFHFSYINKFLNQLSTSLNFISYANRFIYQLDILRLFVNLYPLKLLAGDSPITFDTDLMVLVAPNLYNISKVIPQWDIDSAILNIQIQNVKDKMAVMMKYLAELDAESGYVKHINQIISGENIINGVNMKLVLNQIILDASTLTATYKPDNDVITGGKYYASTEYVRFEEYYHAQKKPMSEIPDITLEYTSSSYFADSFVSLNEYMVLAVMLTLILVTLPFMLQLFQLQIQSDAISESFTFFANTEIRKIINKYGSGVSKSEDDITHVAQLSRGNSNKVSDSIKLGMTFAISFVPMTACCLYTYYSAHTFMSSAYSNANIIYNLYQPFTSYYSTMTNVLQVASADYIVTSLNKPGAANPWNNAANAALKAQLIAQMNRTIFYNESSISLSTAINQTNIAIWGNESSSAVYYAHGGGDIYLYTKELPLRSNELPSHRSMFEKLTTYDIPQAIDLVSLYLQNLIFDTQTDPFNKANTDYVESLKNLLMWFANFSDPMRNQVYFEIIEESCDEKVNQFMDNQTIDMSVAIVVQILACIFLVAYMLQNHTVIHHSLRFFFFIPPDVLTQNHNAMVLIETGHQSHDEIKGSFNNADLILSKVAQGVVLTDRDLNLTDYNPSFLRIVGLDETEDITHKNLTDLISRDENDTSYTDYIQAIKDALAGKHAPDFSMNITARIGNNKVVHFYVNTICLTAHRAANEGDHAEIERIAILFDDCTEIFMREQMLAQEQQQIKQMLSKVMPEPIINDLENGDDSISFVVQSISIGQVRVGTSKQWDYTTSEPFNFYSDVFNEFDNIIKEYDLLCKARTFAHTYTYTGGLFTQINKSDKHADQAVRFAIHLLQSAPAISKKLNVPIELTIGVHTGGPVIAGVMSLKRPNFQLIGPVIEYAAQMKATGIPGQVHITRAVYELIFSSGFKVMERGETKIRGGQTLTSYLVSP